MYVGSTPSASDLYTQNAMTRANDILNSALEQLSTMQRINRGSDDPAGMIAMEELNAEMRSLQKAHSNATRASGMLNVAESGMSQANELLRRINSNIVEAANTGVMSDAMRDALQMETDAAIEALDRLGVSVRYGGKPLLDGSQGFQTSGVNNEQVTDIQVHQNVGGGEQTLQMEVIEAARKAHFEASGLDTSTGGRLAIRTNESSVSVDIAAGASAQEVAESINTLSSSDISAMVEDGELVIIGGPVGSEGFVEVEAVEGDLGINKQRVQGTDVRAMVNGQEITGVGNEIQINTSSLQADVTFAEGFEGEVDPIVISGDALTFALTTQPGQTVQVGLPNVTSSALGGETGRLSDLKTGGRFDFRSGNFMQAQQVVSEAQQTLYGYQARVGAFEKYTIETAKAVTEDTMVSVAGALSFYDTDVAVATSNLARGQILMQTGVMAAAFNNQNRFAALGLLSTPGSFNPWGFWT